VQRRLLHVSDRPHPEVTGVGISMIDEQFVLKVRAENLTGELRNAIADTASPDSVVIVPGGRWQRG
jgi:hypothetical protein